MAPGSRQLRFTKHCGEFAGTNPFSRSVTAGSHEWLPYSKDEVRLKTVNTNLSNSAEYSSGKI